MLSGLERSSNELDSKLPGQEQGQMLHMCCTSILSSEQLEIDLRGQVTVLLLHKTKLAVHTNTPVPTLDFWRLR